MDFRFVEDTEGTAANNNGHIVHRLELHVPGESNSGGSEAFYGDEVGYINVTYIPSDVWEKRYTGDWGLIRWGSDFRGWTGFTDFTRNGDEVEKWLHKDMVTTVDYLSRQVDSHCNWLCNTGEIAEMTENELEVAFDYYTDKLWEWHKEDYKATREFHVDKPRIEFIRVAKRHRRKGYGMRLYKRMAKELDRRYGFPMYAAQLQREEAEAAWEKMVTLDWNDAEEVTVPFQKDETTRYRVRFTDNEKQVA